MTKEELQKYCTQELVENEDGSFSTEGNVNLKNKNITELPKFKKVGGYFNCSNNQLKTLKGSPKKVEGSFDCSHNKLTTLKGAPKEVGGSLDCDNNQLKSLEGSPQKVGGWFDCSYNQLKSLTGSSKEVGGSFYCSNNLITEEKLLVTRKIKFLKEKQKWK